MTAYLRYVIKNEEPLRIADDATSQSGQSDSLRYISGTAVQGFIVSALSSNDDFEDIKKELFSTEMAYLNAYPTTGEHALIPSPKGFYEDKTIVEGEKKIKNVVIKGNFSDGMKRAGLGRFAFIKDGCIHYYNVGMASDMKNMINPGKNQKKNVFRNEMIAAGHYFEGYIRLGASKNVTELIEALMAKGQTFRIGNARTAGMGLCRVVDVERINSIPLQGECFNADSSCYMMLLSDTAMRNDKGEICGLDLAALADRLGVKNLRPLFASTSVRSVHGYNRTWKAKLPAVKAYEAGSVFHFTYDGVIEKAKMESICDTGIGIRRTEGFGRLLFLKDYENVNRKLAEEYAYSGSEKGGARKGLDEEELEALKQTARSYYKNRLHNAEVAYVLNHSLKKGGLAKSKIGSVEAILLQNRYNPSKAWSQLDAFFGHEGEKEKNRRIQKEKATVEPLERQFKEIINKSITDTLGSEGNGLPKGNVMGMPIRDFYTEQDEAQDKLQLLVRMIRFDWK